MRFIIPVLILFLWTACSFNPPVSEKLPILGNKDWDKGNDTVYHTIPAFSFVDQDGVPVTEKTVAGKVYVTDFFFTTCPTICPIMKRQMSRLHDVFMENENVLLISHTIDPEHDTVAVLKEYADRMEINSSKWKLVTGEMDDIYTIARKYFENAAVDPSAPGGFMHSGKFYLLDKERRIRGYYDGTKAEEVDKLMKDIDLLLKEYESPGK